MQLTGIYIRLLGGTEGLRCLQSCAVGEVYHDAWDVWWGIIAIKYVRVIQLRLVIADLGVV